MPLIPDSLYLKRHLLKLVGARFSLHAPSGEVAFTAEQEGFKLKEAIRIYHGEGTTRPFIGIFARQVFDFSATYDVVDLVSNEKIGVFKRKGLASLARDEYDLFDPWDRPFGIMIEDSLALALMRRFLSGLIPQNYDLLVNQGRVVDLRQNFNPFTYHLNVTFEAHPQAFDRRLGLAGAVLLASIEGRQSG